MPVRDDVRLRLAAVEDSEAIAGVLREAFGRYENDYTPEAMEYVTPGPDEIAGRFAEGPIWLVEVDGKAVGTVSVMPEPEWLYIRSMAVLPSAQGLGIGRLLLDTIEQYAVEKGFDTLFLYTTYFAETAIGMYERNGFYKVRDTPAEEWCGTPGLAMEKKLVKDVNQNVIRS